MPRQIGLYIDQRCFYVCLDVYKAGGAKPERLRVCAGLLEVCSNTVYWHGSNILLVIICLPAPSINPAEPEILGLERLYQVTYHTHC